MRPSQISSTLHTLQLDRQSIGDLKYFKGFEIVTYLL